MKTVEVPGKMGMCEHQSLLALASVPFLAVDKDDGQRPTAQLQLLVLQTPIAITYSTLGSAEESLRAIEKGGCTLKPMV